jgi:hypothetical protein
MRAMSHQMGKYCKAYPVARFREFPNWKENTANLRPPDEAPPGATAPRTLGEDDFFFLQENFVVTDDIFLDQFVVFDDVTPEWIAFCTDVLEFAVPPELVEAEAAAVTA